MPIHTCAKIFLRIMWKIFIFFLATETVKASTVEKAATTLSL
jgi:hypothetical protein